MTAASWPLIVYMRWPSARSHTRRVLSSPDEMRTWVGVGVRVGVRVRVRVRVGARVRVRVRVRVPEEMRTEPLGWHTRSVIGLGLGLELG